MRHPGLGWPGRVPNARELVITGTPYVVPYRVLGDRVEVLRVLHAAKRWPKKLRTARPTDAVHVPPASYREACDRLTALPSRHERRGYGPGKIPSAIDFCTSSQ